MPTPSPTEPVEKSTMSAVLGARRIGLRPAIGAEPFELVAALPSEQVLQRVEHRGGVRLHRHPVLRPHDIEIERRHQASRPRRSTPGARRPSARRGSAADGWRCGSSRSRATAPCARAPPGRRACRLRSGSGWRLRPPGRARSMFGSSLLARCLPACGRRRRAMAFSRFYRPPRVLKYTSARVGSESRQHMSEVDAGSRRAQHRRQRERGAPDRRAEAAGRGAGRVSAHCRVGRRLLRVPVRAQLRRAEERRGFRVRARTASRSSSTTSRSIC